VKRLESLVDDLPVWRGIHLAPEIEAVHHRQDIEGRGFIRLHGSRFGLW
jgi:hypothetical protein